MNDESVDPLQFDPHSCCTVYVCVCVMSAHPFYSMLLFVSPSIEGVRLLDQKKYIYKSWGWWWTGKEILFYQMCIYI